MGGVIERLWLHNRVSPKKGQCGGKFTLSKVNRKFKLYPYCEATLIGGIEKIRCKLRKLGVDLNVTD